MINVIDYLEKSVLKFPNKTAVIDEFGSINYSDLERYSKSVGTFISKEEEPVKPIMVYMDKKIDTLIIFLGIVYSGCYYTLVNLEHPKPRVEQIKDVLGSNIVITDEENYERALELFSGCKIFKIEDIKNNGTIDQQLLDERKNNHIDYDPLYVNFTSGSTGTPKGVVISHRSLIDFMNYFTDLFNISENDIIANQAPFDFDVSVKDIYSSLKKGATLVIVPRRLFSNPAGLLDFLCDKKVTTMIWAVSALCLITTFHGLDYKVPETVNKIIFSGEVMPIKHLNIWRSHLPKVTFINVYGPTEITCNCTYHIVRDDYDYENNGMPIGKPFPNERVILLDQDDKIIDDDRIGEICVVGSALGLGYYNNQEQTNIHFMQNPNVSNYIELMYRTGDLGKYNCNHELVFQGRKDFQIKYMGHRIELEEIDKALMNVDGIIRACTLFDGEKQKLYGFYIGDVDKKDLHNKLAESLPIYMIPTKLIKMDEFPLTKNGKIDRKKLKENI